jgi:thiamine biosynthesis lipoprotein
VTTLAPVRLATAAMGTRFELVLGGEDADALRPAGEAALEEIEIWHRRLNRFAPDSLVSHICRSAHERPVRLDGELLALFADALRVWGKSDGAYDPARPPATMQDVILDAQAGLLSLARPGIQLDLGGIAKGHALDAAAAVLRARGVTTAFLHGGTSSAIGLGAPPGESGWRVALAGGGAVTLRDRALSVSATWDGNPHPTLDPRTGAPVPVGRRAVVTGPSARLADAWSTALVVLGRVPDALPPGYEAEFRHPERSESLV